MRKYINSNEARLLFIPLFTLVLIGILLELINFKYTTQFVLVCGPILSAFVALYISSNVAFKNKLQLKEKNIALLKHITVILGEGIKTIELEISNYREFVTDMKAKGIGQTWLKTTPFHFLKVIANYDKQELFDAINSSPAIDTDQNAVYVKIVNDAENAIFVKANSEQQYVRFMESFNRGADNWKNGQLELNKLYGEIDTSPSPNIHFDRDFKAAIYNYNSLIHRGQISLDQIRDIRTNLVQPLQTVLQTHFFQHHYISQLQQTLKIIGMGLDKMDDVQGYIISHLTGLTSDLDLSLSRLKSALDDLNKMQKA